MPIPIRVLVLEDVPHDAELMLIELQQSGFATDWRRVDTEEDYKAALDNLPDIILADYSLPQYNARRALHCLQQRGLDIPFIVVTASISEEVAVECMQQGAADYLLKDRLSRLGPAVQRALAAKRTRDDKRRAEEELLQAKRDLERRVEERTVELRSANDRLRVELAERRRAEANLSFLAEAGKILTSSLNYEATLSNVARLSVPHLADWCAVDILNKDGSVQQLAVAHADPNKGHLASSLQGCYPFTPPRKQGIGDTLRAAIPKLHKEITDSLLREFAIDDDHLRKCRELGMRSSMVVPLVARGHTLGIIVLISAESGRHYTEADLDLAMELARSAALAVDNARLYLEAQEAVHTRDLFLSSVSHDLRNPLTTVKGTAQMLKRLLFKSPSAVDDRVYRALISIEASATKMNTQISELLDVARLELGKPLDLQRAPTDIIAVANGVANDYRASTERHNIVVRTEHDRLVGEWDRLRLERVLGNLVSNAIKFSPEGGNITISVSEARQADRAMALLSIKDNGIGVPAEDLPTIFEPFRRGRNAAQCSAGSGIGLSNARQIVEHHGGSISVSSAEGQGSVFTISLPLNAPSATDGYAEV